MAMVREQDVFFAVGPALDFAITQLIGADRRVDRRRHRAPGRVLATAAAGCLAFALAFLPQLIAYVRLNGHLGPSRLVTRKMTWTRRTPSRCCSRRRTASSVWTPLALLGDRRAHPPRAAAARRRAPRRAPGRC